MVEAKKPGGPGAGPRKTPAKPAEVLEALLEGYLKTASLQTDYQGLYQSLPGVLDLAGDILKKKEESEQAFDQGILVVEKVLTDASEKADQLSKAMSDQHDALKAILADRSLLSDILKSGKEATAASSRKAARGADPRAGVLGLADAQLAGQLNSVMSNIQSMISREVQRQSEVLRSQMASGARPTEKPGGRG
ncbi:hypothetical protein [uncultured Roseibium sp.]|uniref:hypothetical protein n=1 Tax=uncultured Roseibium sp. TaxID=1936171 RepID=UPI00259A736D|nr:hypothetical protein [uncultured Roseibium sp.]